MHHLIAFSCLAGVALSAEPDSPVLAAAKKRQEAIKSIEFVCKFTDVTEIGGHGTTRPIPNEKPRHLPFERESWEGTVRVLIDGERSRLEITKTGAGGGTFRDVIVCDGTTRKRLQGPTDPNKVKHSFGMIEVAAAHLEWGTPIYQPALSAARPLGITGWRSWMSLTEGKPTGKTAVIDGVTTEEWSSEDAVNQTFRSWIDPQAGHTVRRLHPDDRSQPFQTDVNSKRHDSGLWMPTSWETVWPFTDGTPRHTIKATVEQITLNEPIPDREFDLAFPPGVVISDERTNDRKEYLVLEDGSLSRFVRGPNGEPIPSQPLPKAPNWFTANGPLLFGVVLVVVVVALLVMRRMQRKKLGERPA